jgi:predicted membrane protein
MKKINKNRNKKAFKITLMICLILFSIVLFIKILIPMAFGLIGMLISLLVLYSGLNTTAKFFGGFIFLFIYWKVFTICCNILWICFNYIDELIMDKK